MVHSHVPAHSVGAVVSTGMPSVGMLNAVVSTGIVERWHAERRAEHWHCRAPC